MTVKACGPLVSATDDHDRNGREFKFVQMHQTDYIVLWHSKVLVITKSYLRDSYALVATYQDRTAMHDLL